MELNNQNIQPKSINNNSNSLINNTKNINNPSNFNHSSPHPQLNSKPNNSSTVTTNKSTPTLKTSPPRIQTPDLGVPFSSNQSNWNDKHSTPSKDLRVLSQPASVPQADRPQPQKSTSNIPSSSSHNNAAQDQLPSKFVSSSSAPSPKPSKTLLQSSSGEPIRSHQISRPSSPPRTTAEKSRTRENRKETSTQSDLPSQKDPGLAHHPSVSSLCSTQSNNTSSTTPHPTQKILPPSTAHDPKLSRPSNSNLEDSCMIENLSALVIDPASSPSTRSKRPNLSNILTTSPHLSSREPVLDTTVSSASQKLFKFPNSNQTSGLDSPPPPPQPPPPRAPASPIEQNMTPAQKIAREVRRSFSLLASQTSAPAPQTSSEEQSHVKALTPAQVVVQQARKSVSGTAAALEVTSTSSTVTSATNTTKSTKSHSPNNAESGSSFRVISGRKGLPGDGKDNEAIARPIQEDPEQPVEPKIVKRSSKFCLASKASSVVSTQSASEQNVVRPNNLECGTELSAGLAIIPSPIVSNATTPTSSNVAPQTIPSALTPSASVSPTIIPLPVFSRYNNDDDPDSINYSDPDLLAGVDREGTCEEEEGIEVDEETEEEEDYDDEEEEDEDYDSNPLYIVLSTSASPRLKNAYDSAKLVLLPTRRALPLDMPRRLPDPTIKFESEWEQWIASHAFVLAHEPEGQSGSSVGGRPSFENRDGTDWVGLSNTKDRKVELRLKPGTGLAEVRVTILKPVPSKHPVDGAGQPISSTPCQDKGTEGSGVSSDFLPSRQPGTEADPHCTLRGKPSISDEHNHSTPQPLPIRTTTSSSRPPENSSRPTDQVKPTNSAGSSNVSNSDLIRSPSTATESSIAFTQSSSGVSRSSSDGWSDMPPTPPNLVSMVSLPNKAVPLKSQLSKNVSTVDCPPIQREQLALKTATPGLPNSKQNAASEQQSSLSQTRVRVTKIISEETMYRSPPKPPSPPQPSPAAESGLESALSGSKNKKGKEVVEQKLRFKAPKWLRPGSSAQKEKEKKEKALAIGSARLREERERNLGRTPLQRVRLISIKGPVVECWWQDSAACDNGTGEYFATHKNKITRAGPCCLQSGSSGEGTSPLSSACGRENCLECKVNQGTDSQSNCNSNQSGPVPFPRSSQSSCSSQPTPIHPMNQEYRKKFNRSSASLISKRSNRSSFNYIPRRSSSIINNDDNGDGMSCRSSIKRRRSRRMPSGLSILKQGSGSRIRGLHVDLSFLLNPPEEFGPSVGKVLTDLVKKIRVRCLEFEEGRLNSGLDYFKGDGEKMIIWSLKSEILEPLLDEVKSDLKRQQQNDAELDQSNNHSDIVNGWINDDWERFTSLVENIMLAFLHTPLYTRGIAFHLSNEDDNLDSILKNYRKRQIPLSQFEVDLPAALQDESLLTEAVEKLNQLMALDGLNSPPSSLSPETLQKLFVIMDTADEQAVLNVLLAKTPLESMSVIKQTIDILVSVWNEVSTQAGMNEESRRLTPDDLLSLLSSVIVRSGIKHQHSLIHYAKHFRLTGTLSPEVDWAFVSYQAAIAYLQSDPFSENDSTSIRSQALSVSSVPSSPSLIPGWTRRRPASFTPPTTNSTPINIISANSSPSGPRLSLTEHVHQRPQNFYHFPTSTNRQATTSAAQILHRTRTNYGPRVTTLMSGLAVVEPSSPRLEVTPAGYDYSRSMDCLRSLGEGSGSRQLPQVPGKVSVIRPVLAPISTADHRSSRLGLEGSMLSASVFEGSNRSSCIGPWETGLTSIGEVGVDCSLSASNLDSESTSCNTEHNWEASSDPQRFLKAERGTDLDRLRSESSGGGARGPGSEANGISGSSQPLLSRRKTVDLTFLTTGKKPCSDLNSIESEAYRGGQLNYRPTKSCHSRSDSLAGARLNSPGMVSERDLRSELMVKRTSTGSSVGTGGGTGKINPGIRQQNNHQAHRHEGSQGSNSEGWLEWGRKRLTSVTSLNLVGSTLTSSFSSNSLAEGRKDLPGSSSSTSSRFATMNLGASYGGGGGGGSNEGSTGGGLKAGHSGGASPLMGLNNNHSLPMTPAVEALTRAQIQGNLQVQDDDLIDMREAEEEKGGSERNERKKKENYEDEEEEDEEDDDDKAREGGGVKEGLGGGGSGLILLTVGSKKVRRKSKDEINRIGKADFKNEVIELKSINTK